MKNPIRQLLLCCLAVCLNALGAVAADGVVYQFDGWKVTITPGRSAARATRPLPVPQAVPTRTEEPADAAIQRVRTVVQPVSFVNDDAKSPAGAPSPVDAQNLIPPSPPAEQPGCVAGDCGDLPVITPQFADKAPFPISGIIPVQTALYRDIYFSIPFNRAEYNAYPSYRHDATMELLFNQMRNTVIQRGTTNVYQYDMNSGSIYTPYYPYTYGLRIHTSR